MTEEETLARLVVVRDRYVSHNTREAHDDIGFLLDVIRDLKGLAQKKPPPEPAPAPEPEPEDDEDTSHPTAAPPSGTAKPGRRWGRHTQA